MFFDELRAFLSQAEGPPDAAVEDTLVDTLTDREREVMALVVEGRSNAQIADALFLSYRTVERHLSNIYSKLGFEGKAARAAAAARVSRASRP